MRSLRRRLLFAILGAVLAVALIGGAAAYRNALEEADFFFDYQLRQTALVLRDQPVTYLLAPNIPGADAAYDFVIQVWSLDGVRVYLSRPHAILPSVTTLGFDTVKAGEETWRVYGVQAATSVIQVAQPMRVRSSQAAHLALQTLKPFGLLLPILALVISLAVGGALQPVRRLTAQVRTRRTQALDPLPDQGLPDEVRPLVSAFNELLARLETARERERAFMADAAHELRTPLTALQLQIEGLSAAQDEAERRQALGQLADGVRRTSRLVEQVLALARQDPVAVRSRAPVQLDELARATLAELLPLADAKGIDLGMTSSAPVTVRGDAEELRTLVRNLVDNAIRYTPQGGRVDVSVRPAPITTQPPAVSGPGAEGVAASAAQLVVSDTGPGIPEADRERVFDRFYRRPGAAQPGSGLGLAIVRAIATAHGAQVHLDSGPQGQGLQAIVTFATSRSPA